MFVPIAFVAALLFIMNISAATYTSFSSLLERGSLPAAAAGATQEVCEFGNVYVADIERVSGGSPIVVSETRDTEYVRGAVWVKWLDGTWTTHECISTPYETFLNALGEQ